ncbi:Similar to LINE-1 reverse transcriptase homolog (Nycticebus coucang) [Cotesia congregata]|uniref:Similar to LINE-1 reverse transcriptase homolog (Nycticebus coucang) n=1 Tax=Cotesia congregata TaxID=51543 RepID=A0A8J2H9Q5_COTCN|nr:Similar to LINE-1 reverse transcriptase homolog (Nycticebus coucang) [Cotesia congregata]
MPDLNNSSQKNLTKPSASKPMTTLKAPKNNPVQPPEPNKPGRPNLAALRLREKAHSVGSIPELFAKKTNKRFRSRVESEEQPISPEEFTTNKILKRFEVYKMDDATPPKSTENETIVPDFANLTPQASFQWLASQLVALKLENAKQTQTMNSTIASSMETLSKRLDCTEAKIDASTKELDSLKLEQKTIINKIQILEASKSVPISESDNTLLNSIISRLESLEAKIKNPAEQSLDSTVKNQVDKISGLLEEQSKLLKQNNVIIKGLQTNPSSTYNDVKLFLEQKFNIPRASITVYTIGKQRNVFKVCLANWELKTGIMKNKKAALKGTEIYIENDLTPEERAIAFKLRECAKVEIGKGKSVKIKSNQLFFDNVRIYWDKNKAKLVEKTSEPTKVIFWNCHGYENISNLESTNLLFLGITETWLSHVPTNPIGLNTFNHYWSPAVKSLRGRASGGILVMVSNSVESAIIDVSCWWIFIRIKLPELNLIIGTFYLQPNFNFKPVLEQLHVALNTSLAPFKNGPLILGGDFNARMGGLDINTPPELLLGTNLSPGRSSLDCSHTAKGKMLLDFMQENGFLLLNGRTPGDLCGNLTFCGSMGTSIIDLIWSNFEAARLVNNLQIKDQSYDSDHYPLLLSLKLKNDTIAQHIQTRTKLKWDPNNSEVFKSELTNSHRICIDFDKSDLNSLAKNLEEAISDAANTTKMTKNPINPTRCFPRKPWIDGEVRRLRADVARCQKMCKTQGFNTNNSAELASCKKSLSKAKKQKRKEYYQDVQNSLAKVKCTSEFWKTVQRFRNSQTLKPPIAIVEWEEFYAKVYNPRIWDFTVFYDARHPYMDADITSGEVYLALKRCKKNKAPGPDGITNEFLQNLPHNWLMYLEALLNKCWNKEDIPDYWITASLSMLYKKGEKNDTSNYRGIALINNTFKILTSIIQRRFDRWLENCQILPEEQTGFRKNRGCLDHIFTLNAAIQLKLRLDGNVLYCIFIDFRRAFDSVPHHLLWKKLFHLGVSGKLLRFLRNVYNKAAVKIKVEDNFTRDFEVTEGVLQGEKLSPSLFTAYISDLTDYLEEKGFEGINIENKCLRALLYADDTVVFARTLIEAQKILKALEDYFDLNCLSVNTSKTKVMVCRRSGRTHNKEKSAFIYKNQQLEVVTSYNYLGSIISGNTNSRLAAEGAINKAHIAIGTVGSLLAKSKSDAWQTKIKLFDSIISPSLLYAAQVWGLDRLDIIEKTQDRFLKQIFLLPQNTPGYLLRLEFGLTSLSVRLMEYVWNWIICILKMAPDRWPRLCLLRLIKLSTSPNKDPKYNWVAKLELILKLCNLECMLGNLQPNFWMEKKKLFLKLYAEHLKNNDLIRYLCSTSPQSQLIRTRYDDVPWYVQTRCPIWQKHVVAQLRLANIHRCKITCNDTCYFLKPDQICEACGLSLESVEHILLHCSAYSELRHKYLRISESSQMTPSAMQIIKILEIQSKLELDNITNFISSALKKRTLLSSSSPE